MTDRSRSWFDRRRLEALAARARAAPRVAAVAAVAARVMGARRSAPPAVSATAAGLVRVASALAALGSAPTAEEVLELLRRELADDYERPVGLGQIADALASALDAERRHQQRASDAAEARLRRNHAAMMTLARSDSLSRGALEEALREITETAADILGVERSSVWVYNADQTAILCLELFQRSAGTHESGIELQAEAFPDYFQALREERAIPAHDAHTDPRTREFFEVYLKPLSISSMLDAPIRVGGRMIGVICNEQVGEPRHWTIEEEQFAGSLADFIALAMESNQRRETETQLRTMLHEYENVGT